MEVAQHVAEVERHGELLGEAAQRAGLVAEVPTCPGWTVRDLLAHQGMVHRWAASYVRQGPAARAGGRRPALARAPESGVLEWYVEGHRALVAVLRAAPPDLECWTFLPAPSPLAFWARRQAHETAIHRADAEAATGRVPTYDVELAADGIDELLAGFFARPDRELVADPPRSLRVDPTDVARSWHVALGPAGLRLTVDGRQDADLVLSGGVSDLYLLLWNRRPAGAPRLEGDDRVLKLWRERARVVWG